MLRLTKNTDYALMAIHFMACQEMDVVANTKTLAEVYNIPSELLAKIMQMLARDGVLKSKSGPKGGYVLTRSADQITIAEVIEAVEGPIRIIRCEDDECAQMERCTVRLPLMKIERKIVAYLDGVSVAQLYQDEMQPEAAVTFT